ncbi:MAG: helix-turn-helix domain-containing protein [Rhodocyclaceae bacterium]|nr:helix-turn-helix domain-containing protein [Rhodocyclaceae bacterium]MCA3024854.1 helix-turn-helix domain-containing protein [Rhodocyclaceae bacterium]MCA3032320.1 helix-turn-helix domain-containing protein [Rhodocyclaceae bacterium]MCA3037851.1 helix-turn-helix domain-containing protein [Rhodocyclaceae bacterium]MCA3039408.1 helix-turn-helix domain-containing protein [Rhodocyclaceae bacterium]
MNTLDLDAAAQLLKIHPITLKRMAKTGEIPGAKIGRRWVFVDVDLLAHLRSQYVRRVQQSESMEQAICHSISAKTHPCGGSKSPTVDAQYSEALGLPKK